MHLHAPTVHKGAVLSGEGDLVMQSLAGEISILKQITHPNIVQLLEVVEVRPALALVQLLSARVPASTLLARHILSSLALPCTARRQGAPPPASAV